MLPVPFSLVRKVLSCYRLRMVHQTSSFDVPPIRSTCVSKWRNQHHLPFILSLLHTWSFIIYLGRVLEANVHDPRLESSHVHRPGMNTISRIMHHRSCFMSRYGTRHIWNQTHECLQGKVTVVDTVQPSNAGVQKELLTARGACLGKQARSRQ